MLRRLVWRRSVLFRVWIGLVDLHYGTKHEVAECAEEGAEDGGDQDACEVREDDGDDWVAWGRYLGEDEDAEPDAEEHETD